MVWLLALPSWIKAAAVGVVIIGALQVAHWIKVRGLEKQMERLEVNLPLEKAATADLRIAVSDVSANRDKLESRLREQNSAIDNLQVRAKASESRAALLATRLLQVGTKQAEELRLPTTTVPPGHEAMNNWLQNRLGAGR